MTTAINSRNAFHANYGGTDLTGVKQSNVEIRNVGRTVFLKNSCYTWTNHFIKETQPYTSSKLHRYWYFPCARWLFAACAVVALASVLSLYIAVPVAVVMLAWLVVMSQHCMVNVCTLPLVMRQPVVPEQAKLNQLYEVRVEELTGVMLRAHQAGLGYVEARTGRVKLQTFSTRAMSNMHRARIFSLIMLVISLLLFLYATGSSLGLGWNRYRTELQNQYCESLEGNCISCLNNTGREMTFLRFMHYQVNCTFILKQYTDCSGKCRAHTVDALDEIHLKKVASCGEECRRVANSDLGCTSRQIDKLCGGEDKWSQILSKRKYIK